MPKSPSDQRDGATYLGLVGLAYAAGLDRVRRVVGTGLAAERVDRDSPLRVLSGQPSGCRRGAATIVEPFARHRSAASAFWNLGRTAAAAAGDRHSDRNGPPGAHAVQSPRPWRPAGQGDQAHVRFVLSLRGFAVQARARHHLDFRRHLTRSSARLPRRMRIVHRDPEPTPSRDADVWCTW